jgi:sorting nexin-29
MQHCVPIIVQDIPTTESLGSLYCDYQCGFRRGRSTTDQIFGLRMILDKSYEYNVDIHQLYIDYKQVYDSINRDQLIEIIKEFEIPS